MVSIATFLRSVDLQLLREYFEKVEIPIAVDKTSETTTPVLAAIAELSPEHRARVVRDFSRAAALSDDAGQTAIHLVTVSNAELEGMRNARARAFWVFVHRPHDFQRAEEVRYTDDHRRGKQWDGFVGTPGAEIQRGLEVGEAFKAAVRLRFETQKVEIDLFDRRRRRLGKHGVELIQATVYVEGALDQELAFVGDKLTLRDHLPVFEASLTYEPATGSIEVVASDRQKREDFARIFAETYLARPPNSERLPLREFDLDRLRFPFDFPTDPEDAIEDVRVTSLRLRPLDSTSQRVVLECMRDERGTIWQMGESRFGTNSPLKGGWRVTQAKFTVRFRPSIGGGQGKKLPVTITMPHGCDLKDRTEHECLIGEKYLPRWGILRDL